MTLEISKKPLRRKVLLSKQAKIHTKKFWKSVYKVIFYESKKMWFDINEENDITFP